MKDVYKLLLITIVALAGVSQAGAMRHDVTVANFEFINSPAAVSVGDTIRWIWASGTHTTTSVSVPAGAAQWDAPINQQSTMFEYVVTVPGNYTYVCTPHAAMMSASFSATPATSLATPVSPDNAVVVQFERADLLNVTYSVDKTKPVTIGLYDLTGQLLRSSVPVTQSRGTYEYTLSIGDIKSGMYFVVVEIGDARQTRKVTVR